MNEKEEVRREWLNSLLVQNEAFSTIDLKAINDTIYSIVTCIEELKASDSVVYRNALHGAAKELARESKRFSVRVGNMSRDVKLVVDERIRRNTGST